VLVPGDPGRLGTLIYVLTKTQPAQPEHKLKAKLQSSNLKATFLQDQLHQTHQTLRKHTMFTAEQATT
jgi:hypothetical protein